MRVSDRPEPPADFDENPEWTEADFAAALEGPHWVRQRAAATLREAARALRVQADRMDAEADALAAETGRDAR
ncbi:MAG: hypothetical protein EA355_14860 [Rhodobacteraceae bacterium]|nr:MAG: hypothetical protein EA355_14860 [Paracoccaceae bacterium]